MGCSCQLCHFSRTLSYQTKQHTQLIHASVVIIQILPDWGDLPSLKGIIHPKYEIPFLLFMLFQSHMTDKDDIFFKCIFCQSMGFNHVM